MDGGTLRLIRCLVLLLVLGEAAIAPATAAEDPRTKLAGARLLSLSPVDGKAVLQRRSGELDLLAVGQRLSGTEIEVVQVLPDRLVLEQWVAGDGEDEPDRRRRIWLFRTTSPGKASRIQVLDPRAPPEPAVRSPGPGGESPAAHPPGDSRDSSDPSDPSPDDAPNREVEGNGG